MTEARRRSLLGPERTLFMLSLVPYLLERGEVAIDEVAAHFDVTPDLVRRTVELLPMTGIPGESKAYLANDLFEIDYDALDEGMVALTRNVVIDETPRFSAREASALIAGLQYLSALPENADSEAIAALQAKLSRGASSTPRELAVGGSAPDAALAVIRASLASATRLSFDYRNAQGDTERRTVDPLRVESSDQDWYLRAWCHNRQAVRTFRLDRMSALTPSAEPIGHRADEVALPDTLFQGSPDDREVLIELPADAVGLLADFRPDEVSKQSGGTVRVRLRVAHYHALKRLIAAHAGLMRVLEPAEARQAVQEWARAGAAQYTA
ncbi:WYL domain-containing protein [Rathayibacter sp. YIM 133350]|uniref:helix-turn-helix transcriptional regulator n=1 Tax=Rathayibacter sp. YIM 133350 TaxID=3131992 RepID=UPI00307FB63B